MVTAFFVGLGATAGLLAVAHWFPWPRRLGKLPSYGIGVGSLLVGEAIWLAPEWTAILGLALFAVVAGLVTLVCNLTDSYLNLLRRVEAAEHERSYDTAGQGSPGP